jgi:hypothetical protein
VPLHLGQGSNKAPRMVRDVGIHEEEYVPRTYSHALLHGVALSQPAGGQLGIMNHLDPRIGIRRQVGNRPGSVGGMVVDDDDLELDILLLEDRLQCLGEVLFFIPRWNDHSKPGIGARAGRRRRSPAGAPECCQKLDGDDEGDHGGKNAKNQPRIGQGTPQRAI